MPVTAHPAHDKGCHYFGIELIKAPVTDDFVVDLDFVRDHIGAEHRRPRRFGRHVSARPDRPDHRAWPRWRSSTTSACTSTAAWAGSSCRGPRTSATPMPRVRPPRPRRHVDLGRHPQVRLRAEGQFGAAVPPEVAAPPPVLHHRPAGPAATTRRRAWAAAVRAASSPPRGRRCSTSAREGYRRHRPGHLPAQRPRSKTPCAPIPN